MTSRKVLAIAVLWGGFLFGAHGQGLKPPPDMYQQVVPFSLWCVPSFARMVEILAEDFSETPVLLSHMTPHSTLIVFSNKDSSTSTYTAARINDDGTEEVCVIWSGSSEPGLSFSLNLSPVFPEGQRKKDGVEM